MRKFILALVLLVSCVAGNCNGPALICANPLNGSAFGFTLSVPAGFECSAVSTIQALLVLSRVNYVQSSTQTSISVVVSQPTNDNNQTLDGVTVTELPDRTNPNGITFEVRKLALDLGDSGTSTSYSGGTTLPGGNNLIISVLDETDSQTLLDILNQVLDSVQFTQ